MLVYQLHRIVVRIKTCKLHIRALYIVYYCYCYYYSSGPLSLSLVLMKKWRNLGRGKWDVSQTGIQASDFSQVLSHWYNTTYVKNVTQVEEASQTKEMCEVLKTILLKMHFHYCIICIYANKISLSILEHDLFFILVIFCTWMQCEIFFLRVSLRKEIVAIYFTSSTVF